MCIFFRFVLNKTQQSIINHSINFIAKQTSCNVLINITNFNIFVYMLSIIGIPLKYCIVIAVVL